ncbi:hypothetical protein AB9E03_33590, partial [Rhizobium leguminosarum]
MAQGLRLSSAGLLAALLEDDVVEQPCTRRLKAEEETAEDAGAPAVHRVSGLGNGLAFDVMEGVSAASQRVGQA